MSDTQIPPDARLTVTLTAQQWQTVLQVMSEGPFRLVSQIIWQVQSQCMGAAQAEALPEHMPARPNGGMADAARS